MKSKLKIIIPIGIAVIAIALAFVLIRFAPTKASVDIGTMISTAQQYLTEQKYEQAVAEFQKIIDIDPKNVDAYIGLAKAYIGLGDTDKAVEVLEDGYDKTGDERILEMLEKLKPSEETTVATIAETTAEESIPENKEDEPEIDVEEVEIREQEVISFMLPYSATNGDEYDLDRIKDITSNGLEFQFSDYSGNISYAIFKKRDNELFSNKSSIAVLNYSSYSVPHDWYVYVSGENSFSLPNIPDPFEKKDFPISVYHTDGTPIQEIKEMFNKRDQLIKREYYNEKGLNFTDNFEYDKDGKLLKITTTSSQFEDMITEYKYDSNGKVTEKNGVAYKYDQYGNIIEINYDDENVYRYKYDNQGRMIMSEENGYKRTWEYYENGTISKYRSEHNDYNVDNEIAYDEYLFDRSGNETESISSRMSKWHSTVDGKEYSVYKREVRKITYDEYRNQTSQYATYDGEVNVDITYTNSYDSNGRLTSRIEKSENRDDTRITTYEYDNNGNLIKETDNSSIITYTYNSDNKLLTKTLKYNTPWQDDEYLYKYEYDSYGNAVKCTKYHDGEYSSSEEVTEFIRVDIPKYVIDKMLNE